MLESRRLTGCVAGSAGASILRSLCLHLFFGHSPVSRARVFFLELPRATTMGAEAIKAAVETAITAISCDPPEFTRRTTKRDYQAFYEQLFTARRLRNPGCQRREQRAS